MTPSFSAGVLTVTSGGETVATLHLAGSYVTSDFHLSAGPGGSGTVLTDPSTNSIHSANLALLGNYMAAGLTGAANGIGGGGRGERGLDQSAAAVGVSAPVNVARRPVA
jgi:hypothetical protein